MEIDNRLSSVMIKTIQCKKCHNDFFANYPTSPCPCGSYEFEEIDWNLPELIEKTELWNNLNSKECEEMVTSKHLYKKLVENQRTDKDNKNSNIVYEIGKLDLNMIYDAIMARGNNNAAEVWKTIQQLFGDRK